MPKGPADFNWGGSHGKESKTSRSSTRLENKSTLTKLGKSVARMDIGQLRAHIDSLQAVLAKRINEQRAYFEGQLSELSGYVSTRSLAAVKAVTPNNGKTRKRAKAQSKYQSKKNPKLKWSGRGMTPVWMRDEMKGTKLTKDSFLAS